MCEKTGPHTHNIVHGYGGRIDYGDQASYVYYSENPPTWWPDWYLRWRVRLSVRKLVRKHDQGTRGKGRRTIFDEVVDQMQPVEHA